MDAVQRPAGWPHNQAVAFRMRIAPDDIERVLGVFDIALRIPSNAKDERIEAFVIKPDKRVQVC